MAAQLHYVQNDNQDHFNMSHLKIKKFSLKPKSWIMIQIFLEWLYLKFRSAYYQAPGTEIVFASRRLGIMSTLVPGYNIFKYGFRYKKV